MDRSCQKHLEKNDHSAHGGGHQRIVIDLHHSRHGIVWGVEGRKTFQKMWSSILLTSKNIKRAVFWRGEMAFVVFFSLSLLAFFVDARPTPWPLPGYCKYAPPRNSTKKVFVVGLPKSGTTSTGEFFQSLCLRVVKHGLEFTRANGDFTNFTLLQYDVFTNLAEWFYPEMEQAHPGQFVFLVMNRSKESWLISARKHFCFEEWPFSDSNFQSFGLRVYHDEHFRRVYDRFYEEVMRYFGGRWGKDAFLINTEELSDPAVTKPLMKKLANAVGFQGSLPEEYPHSNKRGGQCQYSPDKKNTSLYRPRMYEDLFSERKEMRSILLACCVSFPRPLLLSFPMPHTFPFPSTRSPPFTTSFLPK